MDKLKTEQLLEQFPFRLKRFVRVWRIVWQGTARTGDAVHRSSGVTPQNIAKPNPSGRDILLPRSVKDLARSTATHGDPFLAGQKNAYGKTFQSKRKLL
ncbi:hypothetical protein [Thalassospira sp.]|uniref:hypothetical protein n=1 Tax=Thalassospira sp. TaxID=1912094 RepID=UPI003AA9D3D7